MMLLLDFLVFFVVNLTKDTIDYIRKMTRGDWVVHIVLLSLMCYIVSRNLKAQAFQETYGKFEVGHCISLDYQIYPIVYRRGYTITIRKGFDEYININLQDESKDILKSTLVVGPEYDEVNKTMFLTSERTTLESLDKKEMK